MVGKMDLIGQTLGRYQILEEIGHGGMATVYKAYDPKEDQEVAIKVLSPYIAQEPKFKARFEQEIRVLLHLHHPNIVPVLDYGEIDEYAFIVMPIMGAGTLSQRLRSGPLPLSAAADLLNQISEALDFAHSSGVIHRDIKPSNILIDGTGKAMLTDFGFARVADNSLSLTGSGLIGTPAYMSPEQCRGEQATPRSDQYALGVVLYQMVTGSLPYEAETPLQVVIMHATEPLPPPREVNPELPRNVEAVILKALEKEPARRFSSMSELNQAFQLALHGEDGSDLAGMLDQPTDVYEGLALKLTRLRIGLRRSRKRIALSVLLLFVGVVSAWGFQSTGNDGGVSAETTATSPANAMPTEIAENYIATIHALETLNAPVEGTILAPGDMETIVAGTMSALISTSESSTARAELTQTAEAETETPTPTEPGFFPTAPPTPRPSISVPSGPTKTPRPSNTPRPTNTQKPTNTPRNTPKPTHTPRPTKSP